MPARISWTGHLLGALVLLGLSTPATYADLVYESVNGSSLIYDTMTDVTWTQNADISMQLFTQAQAQTWAANLVVPGVPGFQWSLPSAAEFTSLYTQLDPYGPPGMQNNKYGPTVYFGGGPNDFASNVEMIYWTNATNTDFNFNYGYPGTPTTSTLSAWAVDPNAPFLIPEPYSALLLISGIAAIGIYLFYRNRFSRFRIRPLATSGVSLGCLASR